MTVIKDTTYVNYKYRPELGWYRPAVFYVSGGHSHTLCLQPAGQAGTQRTFNGLFLSRAGSDSMGAAAGMLVP